MRTWLPGSWWLCVAAIAGAEEAQLRIDLSAVEPAAETYLDADLDHLRWVLNEDQTAAYRAGDESERRELLRVAWAALDPTPTTPGNERKGEHYRRLAFVREHFGCKEPLGWDGRGEILLRYGAPDHRQEFVGYLDFPPRETWYFGREGMVFELEDTSLQNRYRILTNPEERTGRGLRAGGTPTNAGFLIKTLRSKTRGPALKDREAEDAAREYAKALGRGRKVMETYPSSYGHDVGAGKLDVAFDTVSFAAPESGRTRLEVHTAVRSSDLGYEATGHGWAAVLDVDVVAKTTDFREVQRIEHRSRDVRESLRDREGHLVLDQLELLLDPGEYVLAIAVRDTSSRRVGTFQRRVEATPFPDGELALSEVQTAFRVAAGEPGDPFLKGDVQVAPWPLAAFPKSWDIYVYFEIYGLEQSPTGDTFYTIELDVPPSEQAKTGWFGSSVGRIVPGVGTSWDGHGKGRIVREYVALDTEALGTGTFDLELRVVDRISERTADRATRITVTE